MNDDLNQFPETPSKTQRKKTMIALQEIGVKLTTFKNAQLDALPLSDKLRKAIVEFNRLPNSHGAKRRQLQYIGRLMRDHDLEFIVTAIEKLQRPQRTITKAKQSYEDYCSLVFDDGDRGINALLTQQPNLERQTLRKFYLDYRRAANLSNQEPLIEIRNRLQKYLEKNQ